MDGPTTNKVGVKNNEIGQNEKDESLQEEVRDDNDNSTGVNSQGIPPSNDSVTTTSDDSVTTTSDVSVTTTPAESVTINKNDKIKLVIDIKNYEIKRDKDNDNTVIIEASTGPSKGGGSRRRRTRKAKNRRARRSRKNL